MEFNGAAFILSETGTLNANVAALRLQNPATKNLVELMISVMVVRPSYENYDGERPELEFVGLSSRPQRDIMVHSRWGKISMLEYYMRRHGLILKDLGLPAVKAWHNGSIQYFPTELLDFMEPTDD